MLICKHRSEKMAAC